MSRLSKVGVPLCIAALLLLESSPASPHNPITTTVVFNREVAAILNQKCSQCHVTDGMAMPLQTYAQARPWAVAIKEEILARRMPPWPAERGYGEFANDISLTLREQEFLISWIDGGVPEGTGAPPSLVDHSSHWMLGEPDAVYTPKGMPQRPSAGTLRFAIETAFPKDVWIRAIDFKPADKRAFRAAFFSIAGTEQYLGGWTPWHSPTGLPDGIGIRLPSKAVINVDVLSGPTELPSDPPRLGLYMTQNVRQPVTSLTLTGERLSPDGRVRADLTLAADGALVELRADMNPRGKSLELKAVRPDGSTQPLLWIKEFKQDWQAPYRFRSPVSLPRGTVLRAVALFDASPATAPRFQIMTSVAAPGRAASVDRAAPTASSPSVPPKR